MQNVTLGKTGLEISRVGFGGIPIQRLSQGEAVKLIHLARDRGYTFIDTARGYTVSESYVGEALAGDRDRWILATKSMARTKEAMEEDIRISLENLRTDHIDLYQCHLIKSMDQYRAIMAPGGAMEALLEAKARGAIGHIGFTAHSADVAMAILDEEPPFETLQFPFNFIEDQGTELFKRAKAMGLGTIAMKPIAGGAFTEAALGLKYTYGKDFIDVAIPGMDAPEQIEENASMLDVDLTLTREEIDRLEAVRSELGTTFCRRCGYCLPCPTGIDIPTQFIFEGYYKRYDLQDWAMDRFKSQQISSVDCVQCGVCETKCPYHLPIMEMLKGVSRTFGVDRG